MLVLMPTCGLGLSKGQKAIVLTCSRDLLVSTKLFVLWASGLLGAIKIAHLGTQNHKFDLTEIERLYQQNYGESLF
jgi:hypothetical protein